MWTLLYWRLQSSALAFNCLTVHNSDTDHFYIIYRKYDHHWGLIIGIFVRKHFVLPYLTIPYSIRRGWTIFKGIRQKVPAVNRLHRVNASFQSSTLTLNVKDPSVPSERDSVNSCCRLCRLSDASDSLWTTDSTLTSLT